MTRRPKRFSRKKKINIKKKKKRKNVEAQTVCPQYGNEDFSRREVLAVFSPVVERVSFRLHQLTTILLYSRFPWELLCVVTKRRTMAQNGRSKCNISHRKWNGRTGGKKERQLFSFRSDTTTTHWSVCIPSGIIITQSGTDQTVMISLT
jgi:hypothetical protein